MDTKSQKSSHTVGNQTAEMIRELHAKACSMGGQSGYFVTKDRMSFLESELDDLMKGDKQTSLSTTELIKLNDELGVVRQRALRAEQQLASAREAIVDQTKALRDAKSNLETIEKTSTSRIDAVEVERRKLHLELKQVKKTIEDSKKSSATDPEDAAKLVLDLRKTQAELAALNADRKKEQSSIREARAQVTALEARLAEEASRNSALETSKRLSGQSYADVLKELDPIPDFDSAILRKSFPEAAKDYLMKAAELKRTNIRDAAWNLSKAASITDPRSYVGFRDYTWAVFETIRDAAPKDRFKFLDLVSDLHLSIATTSGKKLKEIRAEYNSLVSPQPEQIEETQEAVKNRDATWWESIKYDFWFFRKKVSFSLRSAAALPASPWQKIKEFFSSFWSI